MKLKIKHLNGLKEIKSVNEINKLIQEGNKFSIIDNYSEHNILGVDTK